MMIIVIVKDPNPGRSPIDAEVEEGSDQKDITSCFLFVPVTNYHRQEAI